MPGIIVGVDGSHNARGALEWAMREAAIRSVPLTVMTVHEVARSFWGHHPVAVPLDEELLAKARTAVEELVEKATAELGQYKPPSVTIKAINGFPAADLISASKDADMIVVGARGGAQTGGLAAHTPLGSVSNRVLHHAECPVVVVPSGK